MAPAMNQKRQIKRRDILRWTALGAAGSLLVACSQAAPAASGQPTAAAASTAPASNATGGSTPAPASKPTTGPAAAASPKVGFQGTINAYLQNFQPGQPRQAANGGTLPPLKAAQDLADQWQKLHPGVKIGFPQVPTTQSAQEYAAWIKSNQAAGTIPEITWVQDNELEQDIGSTHNWIPITPFINEPNDYVTSGQPGSLHWKDEFIAGFSARERMIDSNFYFVPTSLTSVQAITNVDLLTKSGFSEDVLNKAPFGWSWDQMLADCQKMKADGSIPWAVGWEKGAVPQWITTTMLTGLLQATGLFSKMDTNHDGFIDVRERWMAIHDGVFKETGPERRKMWEMTKAWLPYWPDGVLSMANTDAEALWYQGRAIFMWEVTSAVPNVVSDKQRKFKWDVTHFPDIADAAAQIGKVEVGHTTFPGGAAGSGWAITSTAQKHNNVDLSIDFLKYITTPRAATMLATEEGGDVPVVQGAQGNPELTKFQPFPGQTFLLTIHEASMDLAYFQQYQRLFASYLGGSMSIDQALGLLQTTSEQFATQQLKKVGALK